MVLKTLDVPVTGGRTLAYVYDSGLPEVDRIGREAVAAYAGSNGLDPTAFPSVVALENSVVGTAADRALERRDDLGHGLGDEGRPGGGRCPGDHCR